MRLFRNSTIACYLTLLLILIGPLNAVLAQVDSLPPTTKFYHGDKGWYVESADGNYATHFQLRLQLRYSYPFEQDPVTLDDFNNEKQHIFQIRRARAKIGGHAFTPKLVYYMEYELAAGNLLDYWALYKVSKALNIIAGQYKARYNNERVISSGKQELVERSILTRPFTIDRQTGITVFGNLVGRGALNFSYWVAVLNGTGRGQQVADGEKLMYHIRGQWNMFGEEMKFSGSDLSRSKKWRGWLAGGAVTNESQFTRFSGSGGGQLAGYPSDAESGQYRIDQFFIETAFKKNGFSWQQEYHWKQINDQVNNSLRTLTGNYVQLGTFPNTYLPKFPKMLELAARYSFYNPDLNTPDNLIEEATFALNWFFKGHKNKLSTEISYLEIEENDDFQPGWRFRVQWEASF